MNGRLDGFWLGCHSLANFIELIFTILAMAHTVTDEVGWDTERTLKYKKHIIIRYVSTLLPSLFLFAKSENNAPLEVAPSHNIKYWTWMC